MKEILKRCLLNWNIVKNNTGKRDAPKLSLYPYIHFPSVDGAKGRAVINDCDGVQWEAVYAQSEDVTKDFDLLCNNHTHVSKVDR